MTRLVRQAEAANLVAKDQRSVLVTGAPGGLGSATVRRLADLGWQVFAGVRAVETAKELVRDRERVVPVELDLCQEGSIRRARDEISRHLDGRGLDGLVNNAGLVVPGPIELIPTPALRRQFEVNVIGHVVVTQCFLPLLRRACGRVVTVSGAAGRVTVPMLGAISASKAALESVTDALRMELRHQGVRVSIVTPGLLQTRLHHKAVQAAHRDGYAGDPEARQIYRDAVDDLEERLMNAKEAPVELAVTRIVEALTARRPAARYVVGRDARQLIMLERLPNGVRDRLLMWNRGLKRELFHCAEPAWEPDAVRHW